jgi:archaemetzincin
MRLPRLMCCVIWLSASVLACALACERTPAPEAAAPVYPTVLVQPFEGLPQARLDTLLPQLRKVLPQVEVLPPIPLPEEAYTAPRQRYRAERLLRHLSARTPGGYVTIGLTEQDISTSVHGQADYGIMGLGLMPGNACVASCRRLTKARRDQQFFKIAIHELGHTRGLPHCPEAGCLMGDHGGRNRSDQQTDFCPKCEAHLIRQGWQLPLSDR